MSLGGNIAAHFASKNPERIASIVLVDVGPDVVFEATAAMRYFFAANNEVSSLDDVIAAAQKRAPKVIRPGSPIGSGP
jgi:pimeloyl-ACP methyl ester carboxylesterase